MDVDNKYSASWTLYTTESAGFGSLLYRAGCPMTKKQNRWFYCVNLAPKISYTFSESWLRKDSLGTCPKKIPHWKFLGTERFTKNFHFSRNSIATRVFFLPACCGLNFDATDLPHSSFEPLYPKLFRGTPEVDLVSTVWPPDLPKVRWCRYLSPRNGCF